MKQAFGHLSPEQLNPLMVGALTAKWAKSLARNTAYNYRAKLQQLLGTLQGFGAPPLKAPKLPRPTPRPVVATGAELERLLRDPAPALRLFILLYFQCGLRRSEALRVTPRSWNRETHTITVEVKGGRTRCAAVSPDVEALFLSAGHDPEPDRPFMAILAGRNNYTAETIRRAWHHHRKKCGINPKVTAHDLRRTAASILYAATKDLRAPQQLLGHQNLASTLLYLAPLAPEETRRYQELLRFDRFHPQEGEKPQ